MLDAHDLSSAVGEANEDLHGPRFELHGGPVPGNLIERRVDAPAADAQHVTVRGFQRRMPYQKLSSALYPPQAAATVTDAVQGLLDASSCRHHAVLITT